MKKLLILLLLMALASFAQSATSRNTPEDISGMYSFLQEGEFVQVNLEDGSHVSGFISRYGGSTDDKGAFLNHMFKEGELKGSHLHFKTRTVHGISFEFDGTAELAEGKSRVADGYRILRGKLTQYTEDENKKIVATSREVTLKSFSQDAMADHPAKD